MINFRILLFAMAVLALRGILANLNCGGSSSGFTNPPPPGKIQHVVVIFQENRTPDNIFQDPVLISRGADIASSGKDSTGHMIQLKKVNLSVDYDIFHNHPSFNDMCDLNSATGQCRMDGADLISVACNEDAKDCPAPDLQFGYVDPTQVQPYFKLAEQYTFADRMFQTNQGPSFPAHQFIISGTSVYVYGFRVPLIVVSPYAKAQYISHQQHDFGSILKFIENTFGLPSLGYADAAADDLSDCFDLNQTPLKFQTIPAPLNAQYFLNNKTPATDPDDD